MRIILTTLEGNLHPVEVSEELELINLKALCEQETNIAASKISLTHNGQPLADDQRTLSSYSIKENDIIMIQEIVSNLPIIDFGAIKVPQSRPHSSGYSQQQAG